MPVTAVDTKSNYTYDMAAEKCANMNANVATMPDLLFARVLNYLNIWRHDYKMGDIWINVTLTSNACGAIQVNTGYQ